MKNKLTKVLIIKMKVNLKVVKNLIKNLKALDIKYQILYLRQAIIIKNNPMKKSHHYLIVKLLIYLKQKQKLP